MPLVPLSCEHRGEVCAERDTTTPMDAVLLAGLRTADPHSYEALVRRYTGRLLAVARRLVGNEDDARDCVQEAFLQAFRHMARS